MSYEAGRKALKSFRAVVGFKSDSCEVHSEEGQETAISFASIQIQHDRQRDITLWSR
jgi:hypothetical protein